MPVPRYGLYSLGNSVHRLEYRQLCNRGKARLWERRLSGDRGLHNRVPVQYRVRSCAPG